jgi:hypothetical protein
MRFAIVVGLALSASGCMTRSTESKPSVVSQPPDDAAGWSIVSDSRGGAWRISQKTGAMDYCTLGGDTQLHCWEAPLTNRIYYDTNGNRISK